MQLNANAANNQSELMQGRNCVAANLRRACRAVNQMYATTLEPTGLQRTQYSLLSFVVGHGEITLTALAEVLGMDQSTATRGVGLLKKQGLLESVPGADRRVRVIKPTATGYETFEAGQPLWAQAQSTVLANLGEEKTAQLLSLISEVVMIAQAE